MADSNFSTIRGVVDAALVPFSGGGASDQVTSLTQQLAQLQTISQAAVESTKENTRVVETSTKAQSARGGATGSTTVASTLGGALQGVLGAGMGLSPLISGLVSLFGGGGDSAPAAVPLVKFALPGALNLNAGVSDALPGQTFAVDSAQGGAPRPMSAGTPAAAPTQITVQVQAMDSQSFLDHSNDIALAVRRAMLESSVLNDVIREV